MLDEARSCAALPRKRAQPADFVVVEALEGDGVELDLHSDRERRVDPGLVGEGA